MKTHVAHILVEHKYQAEDILLQIKNGKLFEDLAKKYSTCPSSQQGGDLGVVDERRLDADFSEAASALLAGQISGIVRTKFGYHIIKKMTEVK